MADQENNNGSKSLLKRLFSKSAKRDGDAERASVEPDGSIDADDTSESEKKRAGLLGMFKKKSKEPGTQSGDGSDEDSIAKQDLGAIFSRLLKRSSSAEDFDERSDIVESDVALTVEHGGGKIILVDDKPLAAGLFWQMRSSEDKIKTLAKENSGIGNFDLYAQVANGRQIGLGGTEEGLKAKHLAGVSAFPKPFWQRDWLGAFQIDETGDRYWVVGIRDGMVYQDSIFERLEAARAQFDEESNAPGWEIIYAPDGWGVGGTQDVPLGKLLDLKQAKRLRYTSPVRANLGRIVLVTVLVGTIGGGYYYYTYTIEQQRLAEEQLRMMQEQQLRAAQADIPWRRFYDPMEFVRNCQDRMAEYTVFAPGWQQTDMRCSFNGNAVVLNTGWTRQAGRIAYLRSLVPEEAGRLTFDGSGNRVDIQIAFNVETEDLSGRLSPWAPSRITNILTERFQTMGLPIELSQVVQQPTARRGAQRQTGAVFNYHAVTFRTTAGIDEYFKLLSDVPGVIPDTIDYNIQNNTYSVVARAYHPPIGL